ncbi:rhomboid family intramembrane serine protease [Kangiella sp. HZ709]|uniref:rhomboid family intramembrane serine protease n=1 Tax=Kangiella sp. HZ709 TaxID=2666328 RepID=UPI0012B1099A|nr:rhomboid family intramembrane serine protease [Kangiella sp. HZ709]MRX28004.1 rhomboid family intramembrane serine protease [Kangiella sp. HZ709]
MINWQHFLNRAGKVTIALVAISVIVSLLTWWGTNQHTYWVYFDWQLITQGQIWRLVSPIFLHFMIAGLPIHLLFNMMWLWDLGGSIEKAKGANYLLAVVLITGVGSNLAQYFSSSLFGNGFSFFGGMSGVVYGLLGFIFVRRRFDPFFPLRLNDAIMNFMLIWLVLGFTGLVGSVANAAHLSGLIIGAGLGYLTAKTKRF